MTDLLQAAKRVVAMRDDDLLYSAIDKLSQAISVAEEQATAQAEQQEPVAKVGHLHQSIIDACGLPMSTPLYTAPPQREENK